MSRLTPSEVQDIALLARLRLSDAEADRIGADLSAILDYVDTLRGVDTDGVPPMTHAVPLACPERQDVLGPSWPEDTALRGAPAHDGGFFSVPRILPVEP